MSSFYVRKSYQRKNFFISPRVAFVSIIIVLVFLFSLTACTHTKDQVSPPTAIDGVLDLSQWDFEGNGPVGLDGEWEFYWKKLYDPQHFVNSDGGLEGKNLMKLPRSWNGFEVDGVPIEGMGYATFRLRVKLPQDGKPKAMELPSVYTSHRLWVNGQLVSSDGKVGATSEDSLAKHYHKVITLNQSTSTIELVVQVANFMHRRGGIWQSIKFGNSQDIIKLRERQVLTDMILFGSLFIMGLYYLILYVLRRKDRSPLYFGIFCLLISLRSLLVGEIILLYYFPQISQEFVLKVEYLTFYLGIAFYTLFVQSLFPKEVHCKLSRIIAAVGFGYSLIVIVTKAHFYSTILIYYQIFTFIVCAYLLWALLVGVFRKREGASIVMIGSLVFIATVFNDIFYFNEKVLTGSLTPFGLFIFVIAQSFVISSRFSKAFKEVEHISQRLLSMDKLKDEFLASITHELLTPLNGMIGIAESMDEGAKGRLSDRDKKNISLIISTGRRLAVLVQDILDFTKLKYNDIKLIKKNVNVKQVVEIVLALCKPIASGKSLKLHSDFSNHLPPVVADENRLQQVLYNLIGNAIKYTQSGSIKVSAMEKDGYIHISVADTGVGIPADKIDNIFDSFEQITSSVSSGYTGVGLGLCITKKLVELQGGQIWVESEEGKGTKVTFTLQASNKKMADNDHETDMQLVFDHASTEMAAAELEAGTPDGKILVVDDEPVNCQVLVSQLNSQNYRVDTAFSGKEALEKIMDYSDYDLIITDILMPEMSGYELCSRIREKYSVVELPVLVLTVRNRTEDILRAFERGANDYLSKPFERQEMLARVRTLVTMKKVMRQVVDAELKALQAQISPHFLYNALNAIMGLCVTLPEKAYTILDELSNYLQSKFKFNGLNGFIPLEEELQLVKSYLRIEMVRLGSRLKVEYNIDPGISINIPPLTVQPLVENAVKYGIYPKKEGGTVSILVNRADNGAIIIVNDDGMGMPQHKADSILNGQAKTQGIGLRNVDQRLKRYYGCGLKIISEVNKGTTIVVTIPDSGIKEDCHNESISN
ncbi:MAG: ATP-binding protein [Mahellales bacterium]